MHWPIDSGNQRFRRTALFGPACLSMLLTVLPLSASGPGPGQAGPPTDPLQPIAFLLGQWEGTSEGQPGSAKVQREYSRVLGRYIRVQNRSVYAPQEKNPKGETHEDFGIFSFDTARRRIVFRQFHTEGFVNQYLADGTPPLEPWRLARARHRPEPRGLRQLSSPVPQSELEPYIARWPRSSILPTRP